MGFNLYFRFYSFKLISLLLSGLPTVSTTTATAHQGRQKE